MRVFGIILIVVGILMFIFDGINFQTDKKVADIGYPHEQPHIANPLPSL